MIATDASATQLDEAAPNARVEYRLAPAEDSGLGEASIDLVTVAQALHWLPLEHFFAEVRRVVAPGGALAVWCYTMAVLGPAIDEIVSRYYAVTCGPYWSPERALVDEGYRGIAMPIDEVAAPPLAIESSLTLEQFGGYLRTWSATRKLAAAIGKDPVIAVEGELRPFWGGAGATRVARWPIRVRAGRLRPGG